MLCAGFRLEETTDSSGGSSVAVVLGDNSPQSSSVIVFLRHYGHTDASASTYLRYILVRVKLLLLGMGHAVS